MRTRDLVAFGVAYFVGMTLAFQFVKAYLGLFA